MSIELPFIIDRLSPPLTGNYFEKIIPNSVEVISCGIEGCATIATALFEQADDKMSAKANISAHLIPNTRIILQVKGFADGKEVSLLVTSPIEVN